MTKARRFPPPWSVEEQPACFIVRDHDGQQLAYVYFEEEPGRRSAAKLLSKDEARQHRQAAGAASLPKRGPLISAGDSPQNLMTDSRGVGGERIATRPLAFLPS